jgi:hypothetical protein
MALTMTQEQWAAFGQRFYETYRRGGFARMPKREVDILVFHLLEQHGDLGGVSPTALAQRLGSTPSRIRSLRQDARYLYWGDAERAAEVRRVVFEAIANEVFRDYGDHIGIQVTDPFVCQVVEDLLASSHVLHDTSFNRSILKVDREGLAVIVTALLSDEQRAVLAADPATKAILGDQELGDKLASALKEQGETLGEAVRGEAFKKLAGTLVSSSIAAAPAVLPIFTQLLGC